MTVIKYKETPKMIAFENFFYTVITDLNDQNINEIRVVLFVYF